MHTDQKIPVLIEQIVSLYREAGNHLQQNNEGQYLNKIAKTGLYKNQLRSLMGDTFEFSDHWLNMLDKFEDQNDSLAIGYLYKLHANLMEDQNKDLAGITLTARIYFLAAEYLELGGLFTDASHTYLKARAFYSKFQNWDGADTAYYRHLICHRKDMPYNSPKLIKAILFEWTTGYGYKPFRLLASSLIIIHVFAAVFLFLDLIGWGGISGDSTNIWDYVYFSGITFLTVGYGDIIPSSIPAKVIALLVGFVGLGSYSLFIAMMARKMFKF